MTCTARTAQEPWKSASRFSTKAAIPSFASADVKQALLELALEGEAGLQRQVHAALHGALDQPHRHGGAAAGSGGGPRQDRVQERVVGVGVELAVDEAQRLGAVVVEGGAAAMSSMAREAPTARASRWVPPVPGRTPRATSGRPHLPEPRRA